MIFHHFTVGRCGSKTFLLFLWGRKYPTGPGRCVFRDIRLTASSSSSSPSSQTPASQLHRPPRRHHVLSCLHSCSASTQRTSSSSDLRCSGIKYSGSTVITDTTNSNNHIRREIRFCRLVWEKLSGSKSSTSREMLVDFRREQPPACPDSAGKGSDHRVRWGV